MPLFKSGSKAAVSKNIATEVAAGKPRDQAVAIALETARKYGKGRPVAKAHGGGVAYRIPGKAGGGPLDTLGSIFNGMAGKAPGADATPGQQAASKIAGSLSKAGQGDGTPPAPQFHLQAPNYPQAPRFQPMQDPGVQAGPTSLGAPLGMSARGVDPGKGYDAGGGVDVPTRDQQMAVDTELLPQSLLDPIHQQNLKIMDIWANAAPSNHANGGHVGYETGGAPDNEGVVGPDQFGPPKALMPGTNYYYPGTRSHPNMEPNPYADKPYMGRPDLARPPHTYESEEAMRYQQSQRPRYADGGETENLLPPTPPPSDEELARLWAEAQAGSGVPSYLRQQQAEGIPGAVAPEGLAKGIGFAGTTAMHLPGLAAEATGIPMLYRKGMAAKDDLSNIGANSQALADEYAGKSNSDLLWEAGQEALPQAAAAATGPLGQASKALPLVRGFAEYAPRAFGAIEGGLSGLAAQGVRNLMSPASAGEAESKPEGMPEVLPTKPAELEKVQELLKQHGLYGGKGEKIDGKQGDATNRAFQKYWADKRAKEAGDAERKIQEQKAGAEAARAQADTNASNARILEAEAKKAEEARKKAAEEQAVIDRREGNEKIDAIRKNKSGFSKFVEDWSQPAGLTLGAIIGGAGRYGVVKASDAAGKLRAAKGDDIMSKVKNARKPTEEKDMETAGLLNDFSRRGHTQTIPGVGKREVPFKEDSELIPAIRPNPAATPTEDLYTQPKLRQYGTDAAILGTALGESLGVGQAWQIPKYQEQRDKALAELKLNPNSQPAIDAYLAAEDNLHVAKGIGQIGYGVALGYAPTALKIKRGEEFLPNSMGKYAGERSKLTNRLNQRGINEAPAIGGPKPPLDGGALTATPSPAGKSIAAPIQAPLGSNAGGQGNLPPPLGQGTPPPNSASTSTASPSSASSSSPAPKPRPVAEEEFAANKRSRKGELAAQKRKAKKSGDTEKAVGGPVEHHSRWQIRNLLGRFAGGPVYDSTLESASGERRDGGAINVASKYASGGIIRKWFGGGTTRPPVPVPVATPASPVMGRIRMPDPAPTAGYTPTVASPAPAAGYTPPVATPAPTAGYAPPVATPAPAPTAGIRIGPGESIQPAPSTAGLRKTFFGAWVNANGEPVPAPTAMPARGIRIGPNQYRADGGALKDRPDPTAPDHGPPKVGPIVGDTGGREDALPISVVSGSFVIPADVVAALGGGNSLAGMKSLTQQFGDADPTDTVGPSVPIKISDGEYVISPKQVAKLGNGDVAKGHRVLDALVLKIRAQHIKTLKSLPGPRQD